MPTELSPREFQHQMYRGFERNRNFRKARLMFLRQMVGQYYDQASGAIGNEPLNLIFNAIRTIVPNVVMNFPEFNVDSQFVAHRGYGELLGMALDFDTKKKRLTETYRRLIVDSIFTVGTLKTGLGDSGTAITFDDWGSAVDPGATYTELVDFDDLVIDPTCTDLKEAAFIGDRIRVPRATLMDTGLYRNDLLEQIPTVDSEVRKKDRVRHLSQKELQMQQANEFLDEIEVVELWVPSANATVTVPWGRELVFEDYLRVEDYYGPDSPTGPYTFLQLGVPVPNNPFHAAPVSMWYDLHVLANRLAKKTVDQAERQKTLVGYQRSAADDAQEALDAGDGEAIAMDDPNGIKEFNFGGQQGSNEAMTGQLQMWFNMMAANPQGISGQNLDAGSATEAQILQGNANVGLNDMKDLVYIAVAEEASKRAWFFHTDPLIELPLIKRVQQPAITDPMSGMMVQPAQINEVQVFLTPEARSGDWMDFTFEVQPESMGRIDSQVRLRQAIDFAAKILPTAAAAAQQMLLLGIPFSVARYIIRMAKEVGITWMDEVFFDPEFQMQMATVMARGPQPEGTVGTAGAQGGGGLPALIQNGQPANVPAVPGLEEMMRQDQQAPAAESQRDMGVRPLA